MKKILSLVVAACAALFATTACKSVNTNDAAVQATATVQKDFKADIAVQDKAVSGEATVHNVLGIITWGVNEFADEAFVKSSNSSFLLFVSPTTAAKQGASYKACDAAKADYILGAKYRIDTKDFFVYKKVQCKVTGYPANLKGVK